MPTKISSIFRKITRSNHLNIFSCTTHERYEENWRYFDADFWVWQGQNGVRTWNTEVSIPPSNYHFMLFGQIFPQIDLDLCISQSPDVHFPIAKQLSDHLDIPIINLWHTFPTPGFPKIQKKNLFHIFKDYQNIFITEESRQAWGFDQCPNAHVIHHAIDNEYWKPNGQAKPQIMTACNDFVNRDIYCGWNLWVQTVGFMTNQMLPVKLVGKTPGISQGAHSKDEMLSFYQQSSIYLNTALASPIPMSLLEAMSCGLCPISTKQGMASRIIQHGYNGFLCDPNPQQMRQYCLEMLNNPQQCKVIGERARQTIIEMFPIQNFVNAWQKIFKQVLGEK